jgi:hypothetical protein
MAGLAPQEVLEDQEDNELLDSEVQYDFVHKSDLPDASLAQLDQAAPSNDGRFQTELWGHPLGLFILFFAGTQNR